MLLCLSILRDTFISSEVLMLKHLTTHNPQLSLKLGDVLAAMHVGIWCLCNMKCENCFKKKRKYFIPSVLAFLFESHHITAL